MIGARRFRLLTWGALLGLIVVIIVDAVLPSHPISHAVPRISDYGLGVGGVLDITLAGVALLCAASLWWPPHRRAGVIRILAKIAVTVLLAILSFVIVFFVLYSSGMSHSRHAGYRPTTSRVAAA